VFELSFDDGVRRKGERASVGSPILSFQYTVVINTEGFERMTKSSVAIDDDEGKKKV
jgi:hypothetical protein